MDKKVTKVASIFLGLLFMAFSLNAQDLNDAKRAIKKGDSKKRAEEYKEAIEAYSNCVSIIKEMEEDADEEAIKLMTVAEKKWVKTHLDYANTLLKQNMHDDALEHYNEALELAQKYNQEDYAAKAERNIPKVWYQKGKLSLEMKSYEDALEYFDKAIEGDPDYGWAYIRKAQVYRDMDQPEDLERAVSEAVSIGEDTGSENVVKTANQVAYRYFYNKGATALKNKDYSTSAEKLQKAVNYNGSATIYHYLALSYGQLGEYEKAIENENTAIEMLKEEKSAEEMAKYYYTIAGFYKETGNTSKACNAYENAAYGDYKANAEYQIEHILECN